MVSDCAAPRTLFASYRPGVSVLFHIRGRGGGRRTLGKWGYTFSKRWRQEGAAGAMVVLLVHSESGAGRVAK
jgi:hypothetical protein